MDDANKLSGTWQVISSSLDALAGSHGGTSSGLREPVWLHRTEHFPRGFSGSFCLISHWPEMVLAVPESATGRGVGSS